MLYLGIDPGFTTGAAWCSQRDKQFVIHDFEEVVYPTFLSWVLKEWEPKVAAIRNENESVFVVCEDYIQRTSGTYVPGPVQKQIGFMYCKALDLGWEFFLSQPYNKKAGYKLGKIPQPANHWRDALSHVYFAKTQGLDPSQKIIW